MIREDCKQKTHISDFYDVLLYKYYGIKMESTDSGYKCTYYWWDNIMYFDKLERVDE